MIERELLPTRAAMADELADMLRVVLAKWTPGNPARLSHVRALLARYDALPDAAQLDADCWPTLIPAADFSLPLWRRGGVPIRRA